MPQFDKITFFNQIFWFLLAFFAFYFLILKSLLPVIAASLKTRKKIVSVILSKSSLVSEHSSRKNYVKNLQKMLKTYKTLYGNGLQKALSHLETSKGKVVKKVFFLS